MQRAVIIRLFPNRLQEHMMRRFAGSSRWVWNWGLALNEARHKNGEKVLTGYELSRELTIAKQDINNA